MKRLLKLLGLGCSSRAIRAGGAILPLIPETSAQVKKVKKITSETQKTTRELMIQVDLAKNMTTVFSQYSPPENLTMQLDALCVTMAKCIEEGEKPEAIHQKVKFYLDTIVMRYSPKVKTKTN